MVRWYINHHRLLRQKTAKYHIRTQKYTKLHTQNTTASTQFIAELNIKGRLHQRYLNRRLVNLR